jgi:hypothetical protein
MFGFFAALLAGVLLAFAFQLTLTQLSFAAGVSAVGDLHKVLGRDEEDRDEDEARHPHREHTGVHREVTRPVSGGVVTGEKPQERAEHLRKRHDAAAHREADEDREHPSVGSRIRKGLGGAGLWALITSSIALFFASWLAVELTSTLSFLAGAVIGLAVWACFHLVVSTWEAAALSSLAGSVTRLAVDGSRALLGGVGTLLRGSREWQLVHTARDIAGAVREELTAGVDAAALERRIDRWVRELEPQRLDADKVKREVLDLLKHVEIREDQHAGLLPDEEQLIVKFQRRGLHVDDARRAAGGVLSAVRAAREAWQGGRHVDAAVTAAAVAAGWTEEKAKQFRERVEEVLRRTGVEQLDPEALVQDLETLFTDPSEGAHRLYFRMQAIDKDAIVALLRQREGWNEAQARDAVERVEGLYDRLSRQVRRLGSDIEERREPVVAHADGNGVLTEVVDRYVETYRRPDWHESTVRRELRLLMEDPSAESSRLVARLRALDRDDLRRMIAAAPGLDEDRAEQLLGWMEQTRDEVVQRVERATEEARRRAEQARELAVEEAEEVRATAAAAAWWAFAGAAVSGTAAALGGVVAVAS